MKNLDELLLTVQKPGRYTGGEWNAVKKDWTAGRVKVLLAFPDLYEIGMSYLGMKILYGLLNGRDDCLCERAFSPWPDFEKVLRDNGISIFSLESRKPIREFDIIGFSLAYELTYTNVLNILDLGGIPAWSHERTGEHPLIIAGGPSCYNPEPMAGFIDAFVIGDGEETAGEIVEVYKRFKGDRKAMLRNLAKIDGVYVPSLYKIEYNDDRTIKSFSPAEDGVPANIRKRFVKNLDEAFYPTRQIVPNIAIVHDRIAIEIMRGCKNACRFCQATAIYRPCRERSKDEVMRLATQTYAMTGYDEISLLSLSSGDYTGVAGLIEELNRAFSGKYVSVSVPSLRIEDVLKDLPTLISKVKKSGLTFAPECASEPLRKTINKNIDIEKLFRAASEYYKNGWRRVKLYFMIGLPSESEEDVLAIRDMVYKISDLKKKIDGRPATVAVSVNAFVPKPHTYFQFEAMDDAGVLREKQKILRQAIKSRMVELDFHPLEMSYLEAVCSRGDRNIAKVIYESWRAGARFDGWKELLKPDIWSGAFLKTGIDPVFYINRKKNPAEVLPWSFIHSTPQFDKASPI